MIAHSPLIGPQPSAITDPGLKEALDRHLRATAVAIEATHTLLAMMQLYHEDDANQPKSQTRKGMVNQSRAIAELRLAELPQQIQKTQQAAYDYREVLGLGDALSIGGVQPSQP